jgi:protein-disulfide isomerase
MTRRGTTGWFCLFALVLATGAASTTARAQGYYCDALTLEQQQTKREILAALHPYDGCDETMDRCLAKKPPHPVVLRLASDICRHIKAGKGRQDIERALAKRAQTMVPTAKLASFTVDENTIAGNPQAPVRVVVYACARCPFCKVQVPALYKAVTDGALKDKVRLYFRPFPLRDHAGSTEGGLAMVSAARLGRFWPFVIKMYERFDSFCPKLLSDWAVEAGMDKAAFEREMADPKNRDALVASKQEGIRNKVEATPTLFIDGRKYVYEAQQEAVVDVLLEEYESVTASKSKP